MVRPIAISLLVCVCLSGCHLTQSVEAKASSDDLLARKKPTPETKPPPANNLAVPTHYLVAGYNQTQEAKGAAEDYLHDKKLEPAGAELKRAIKVATETLDRVDREKTAGSFQLGLKYPTQRDGFLTAEELLPRLIEMRESARKTWTGTVGPAIVALLKKKYHATSQEQVAVLEELGRPKESFTKRGELCWLFDVDNQFVTYCWDSRGLQVRRLVRDKPDAAIQAAQPAPQSTR